jgi:hypothetical protein
MSPTKPEQPRGNNRKPNTTTNVVLLNLPLLLSVVEIQLVDYVIRSPQCSFNCLKIRQWYVMLPRIVQDVENGRFKMFLQFLIKVFDSECTSKLCYFL